MAKYRRVDRESHKVAIEAEEPECEDGGERTRLAITIRYLGRLQRKPWRVWGNGGGVIINEVCVKCGVRSHYRHLGTGHDRRRAGICEACPMNRGIICRRTGQPQ